MQYTWVRMFPSEPKFHFPLWFVEVEHPCVFEAASWTPLMHSTHSDALTCYFSRHTPWVSLCPYGNLYLPPLDCRRGRPPLSSSCGVWIWVCEVSDTDREAKTGWGLRPLRRLNNISELKAVSVGDTWAQWSVCLQLLGEQPLSSAYVSMLVLPAMWLKLHPQYSKK